VSPLFQFRIISENFPKIEKKIRQKLVEKEKALMGMPAAVQSEVQAAGAFRAIIGDLRTVVGDLYRVEYGSVTPVGASEAGAAGSAASSHAMEMMPRLQEFLGKFEDAIRTGGKHIMSTKFADSTRTQLSRLAGYMVSDLMTHGAVKVLARAEVGRFEEPARDMLHGVHGYFSSLCSTLVQRYFADHPALRDHVETALECMLKESLDLCIIRLKEQLAIEMDEVYTLNHYYSDTVAKVLARLDEVAVGDAGDFLTEVSPFATNLRCAPYIDIFDRLSVVAFLVPGTT
jgi:hypothetical protein